MSQKFAARVRHGFLWWDCSGEVVRICLGVVMGSCTTKRVSGGNKTIRTTTKAEAGSSAALRNDKPIAKAEAGSSAALRNDKPIAKAEAKFLRCATE